jgi:1-phosphofructokinase family hexose kinase
MHELGGPVIATGFLGGHIGEMIADSLGEIGVPGRFVETAEESRTCIAILDSSSHSQTEINENGPNVAPAEVAALEERFAELLDEGVTRVALCGSLPPRCPVSLYADLIGIAKRKGIPVALDASGEALRLGIESRPDLVKCNQLELRAVLPLFGDDLPDLIRAARSLLGGGTRQVAITMGEEGAIALDAESAWFAAPPPISFVSAVGSGDAFLAAYLLAEDRGESHSSRLEWGVAAGAANAAVMGAGFCKRSEIERLRIQTRSRLIPAEDGVIFTSN